MKIALVLVVVTLAFGGLAEGAERGNVTNRELEDFAEELLKKDVNNAAHHIRINYQGRTNPGNSTDEAPQPLVVVDSEVLKIPTIAKLHVLYDNYVRDVRVNEQVTPQEQTEENNFLDAVMKTSIMNFTMKFLADKGIVSRDAKVQKDLLRQIWFDMYSRAGNKVGSSAFEHVFLGELKRGEVSGLHNWIYFSTEEAHKNADYLGYVKKVDLGDKGAILKLHFKWDNVTKPVGTMFIGTSPELEMALYTVCYLTHPDKRCRLRMAGKKFNIITHTFNYKGKDVLGTAFPEI